jgi:hypothetical protein
MRSVLQESSRDRAQTHSSSKFTLALVAVWSIGIGVLLRDVAQDWLDVERERQIAACKADREQAAEYASHLSKLLTDGGRLTAPGTVVSCKAKHIKVNS